MQTKPAADPTPIVVGPASPYATSPDTLNSAARGSSSMRLETGEHVVFSWVSIRSAGLAAVRQKDPWGSPVAQEREMRAAGRSPRSTSRVLLPSLPLYTGSDSKHSELYSE